MIDLFISYSHSDTPKVREIAELFENEGWVVWWDKGIRPGMKWEKEIDDALNSSKAVVAIWSNTSKNSKWVHKEVRIGLKRNLLIPIQIEQNSIPIEFLDYQATDLSNWNKQKNIPEINTLLNRICEIVPPSRKDTVRIGYKTDFFGKEHFIPLPSVPGTVSVLPYNHFTVVMNPARRLAYYTAYNIDGTKFVDFKRPGSEEWQPDQKLPDTLQMDMSTLKGSEYDRGHLLANATIRWGEFRSAIIASRQAFYWPNMAPQHKMLNRYWWFKLEKLERELAKQYGLLTGFSGIGFTDKDKQFRDTMELESGLVATNTFSIPGIYWKVIVVKIREKLHLAAFLLNQFEMLEANLDGNIDIRDYSYSLKYIEEKTGIGFEESLHHGNEINISTE